MVPTYFCPWPLNLHIAIVLLRLRVHYSVEIKHYKSQIRIRILIAPGWPNMPWFWDLVAMSSQIPLCLPNLVSQPFNQTLRRKLSNLNSHAWLLEPQQSRSRGSLRQWQHELRLLKEDQPDPSMRQSGPFLQSGASVIRWTSGHHL